MGMDRTKERATFSIDPAVKHSLDSRIPKSRRSAFVERAIAEALKKEAVDQLKQTLDRIQDYSGGGEDSVAILRRIRQERADQLHERHDPET